MRVREGLRRPRAATGVTVLAVALLLAAPAASAPDRTKPTTPTNLRVTGTTSTSVSLAWNPASDNSGSFTYTVRELNSGQTRAVAQTQTTYTWTGLTPSKTYRFLVFARDAAGNQSSNSNTVTAATPAAPALPAPASFRVTGATSSSVSFAWDAVPGAATYQVARGVLLQTPTTQTSFTVSGLIAGTSYTFSVRAFNSSAQPSPWSPALVASTVVDVTPPTVPVVSGAALSPGVVRLTWPASTDASEPFPVGYNVYVDGKPAHHMLPEDGLPPTAVIHNLRASTTYELTVRSYDYFGNFSAPSEVLTLTTPAGTDTQPPAAPNLLTATPRTSTVELGWSWPADNVGVTAFEVYMDGELVEEVLSDVHYGGVNTWVTVRHLVPGSSHSFAVRARDEAGNVSAASNAIAVTLQPSSDTTPPTAPFVHWGLNTAGCAFVDFGFDGQTDNVTPWHQLDIEIYEDGYSIGTWRTEVHEAGFGRHTYHLKAVDAAGNTSPASNAVILDNGFRC